MDSMLLLCSLVFWYFVLYFMFGLTLCVGLGCCVVCGCSRGEFVWFVVCCSSSGLVCCSLDTLAVGLELRVGF